MTKFKKYIDIEGFCIDDAMVYNEVINVLLTDKHYAEYSTPEARNRLLEMEKELNIMVEDNAVNQSYMDTINKFFESNFSSVFSGLYRASVFRIEEYQRNETRKKAIEGGIKLAVDIQTKRIQAAEEKEKMQLGNKYEWKPPIPKEKD